MIKIIIAIAIVLWPSYEESNQLYFVGDIMFDRGVEEMVLKNDGDWNFILSPIIKDLQKADFLFGNLESMISDKGYNIGSIYSFRADPRSIEVLSSAGFSALSIANNHSFDYTVEALKDTMIRLKEENIEYVGGGFTEKEAHSPLLYTLPNETIIGILGYTSVGAPGWQARPSVPGVAWMDEDKLNILQRDIEKTKEKADIVIVSIHFGNEYEKEASKTQRLIGESAIDFGADLVVGHHPHVLQPVEKYKEGWIAWSLGNFIFDQGFSEETMTGAVLKVKVRDRITSVNLVKTKQNSFYQVEWK